MTVFMAGTLEHRRVCIPVSYEGVMEGETLEKITDISHTDRPSVSVC